MENVLIFATSEDTLEIHSLLNTLDIAAVKEFVQKRPHPHRVGFLGPGKLKEIEEEIKNLDFDAIVISEPIKPSQHHYLEMRFQVECIDRTGIILKIFTEHAHTPEAIAQVTLAKLRYELPFLREWIHKAKRGDRPGFLAGGAYATDVYFEHAKAHVRRIEESLKELSKQREITRAKRHAKGYSLVSLAGYTNAGKSALFNRLCGADAEVDSRLFSTLSTTTRKVQGIYGSILMVDTVGFIRDLPPNLIDAFNSTLEEIFYADLILLVFDCSDTIDAIRTKLRTCMDILLPKMELQALLILANKADLVTDNMRKIIELNIKEIIHPYPLLFISAESEEGLEDLRNHIRAIEKRTSVIDAILPLSNESLSFLSRLRARCEVADKVVKNSVHATIRCKEEECQRILGLLSKAGALEKTCHLKPATNGNRLVEKASKGSEGAPLAED